MVPNQPSARRGIGQSAIRPRPVIFPEPLRAGALP
nr:MAG TPA: hypothetical protein [Caudoviricetes sp.]